MSFKHRGNFVWNDESFLQPLCILKLHRFSRKTDSGRNVIISTKRCQVQMALSCPTTIAVEFSTLEISSGTAFPYYRSIKRSKLPACATKPPFDRASGLPLMVAIKALRGVFLQGLTGRLQTCPPPFFPDQPATQPHRLDGLFATLPTQPERCTGTRYNCVHKHFQLLYTSQQQSVGLCLRRVIRARREETLAEELSAAC